MADRTQFAHEGGKVIVHRRTGNGREIRVDEFEGTDIRFKLHENGDLVVTSGTRPIAAYPSGTWDRVTPDVRN